MWPVAYGDIYGRTYIHTWTVAAFFKTRGGCRLAAQKWGGVKKKGRRGLMCVKAAVTLAAFTVVAEFHRNGGG
jgi:hypothetical protein